MTRFSAKGKEIFDVIWYQMDVDKAEKLCAEELDPIDLAFGKLWIAYLKLQLQRINEFLEILTEIENLNKKLHDNLMQFFTDALYCLYYCGYNSPTISKEKAENHFDQFVYAFNHNIYEDDWEEFFTTGWYNFAKGQYTWLIKDDHAKGVEILKKIPEVWVKVPQDGAYLAGFGHILYGWINFLYGNLNEAEQSFQLAIEATQKYNNLWYLTALADLSFLHSIRGNLLKARELNAKVLEIARHFNSRYHISLSLTLQGSYLFSEGRYDEALEAYTEGFNVRKLEKDPLVVFMGYFRIFGFYYDRFEVTREMAFFKQAEETLVELQRLSKTFADNKTIVNYTQFAMANLFKYGNLKKRGKAVAIFEELIDLYPNNISMLLEFLELLFEDVIVSEDQETLDQIELLMEKVNQIPLLHNIQAIPSFISQQIILAKYQYYIKGDISGALQIFHDAKEQILTYKLDNLVTVLETEIRVLETEITKWKNIDISVKERIQKSEFNKYIQQALKQVDKQF